MRKIHHGMRDDKQEMALNNGTHFSGQLACVQSDKGVMSKVCKYLGCGRGPGG